jgi:hypothetical protein
MTGSSSGLFGKSPIIAKESMEYSFNSQKKTLALPTNMSQLVCSI